MTSIPKGKSPFYPGQPVPVELFVGRRKQIERIMVRGAGQVAEGKSAAFFIEGEYGIGKTSIAEFTQWTAEREYKMFGINVMLGGAHSLEGVSQAILEATVRAHIFQSQRLEKVRDLLGKYITEADLFGIKINVEALRQDAPKITSPLSMLNFLYNVYVRAKTAGYRGIYLILDELNGITGNPEFAHFIKSIWDANATSREQQIPLLLTMCGVDERRKEMIRNHEPVARIFDVVSIENLSQSEMNEFFARAFQQVSINVDEDALKVITEYSAGFPKIMHLVGDAAFWHDNDGRIDHNDALHAVLDAAEEVGKKYVDKQVYKEIRSGDYLSILNKIGALLGPQNNGFTRTEISSKLTSQERDKLDNFINRMIKLNVIRRGTNKGSYLFNLRIVALYIWMQSRSKELQTPQG